jgi:oxygen-dependent protoporphyrinogen oxidase
MTAGAEHHEIVIVGAGISGLTAAWRLRDRDILVLEAADIVGGRLKTETRDPYWLNLGAHVLMAGGPMATLAAEVGVPLVEPPGDFLAVAMGNRVARANSATGMFFRLPLSLAGRISLARTGLKLMLAKRRDHASLEAMSFREFLGAMHPDVEALMRVVANRLTGELDDISALVGVNGFDHLWLGSRLNIAGGSAELPFALARALAPRVVTGAKVSAVRQTPATVLVAYESGGVARTATADRVIVAVPAPTAREIVGDLPPALDRALAAMRYTPFVVAGIFTRETGPMPWDDLYALATPDKSFCMLFNPGNALRRGTRQPGGALVAYTAAERATAMMQQTDMEIRARYLDDLAAIFPATRDIVAEVIIQRWQRGTAMGYRGRAANVATLAAGHGRIAFAGDYMMPVEGVDATESGDAAAKAVAGTWQSGS